MLSLKAINLQGRLRILIGRELYARTSASFTKSSTFRRQERKFSLRRKMRNAREVSVYFFMEVSSLISAWRKFPTLARELLQNVETFSQAFLNWNYSFQLLTSLKSNANYIEIEK